MDTIDMESFLERFNRENAILFQNKLCERCVCSALAAAIEKELQNEDWARGLNVDVEYNRLGTNVKTLSNNKIFVDLVIHQRNDNSRNLVCVEMKKATNYNGRDDDKSRLAEMTSPNGTYRYQKGYFLLIGNNGIYIDQVFPAER